MNIGKKISKKDFDKACDKWEKDWTDVQKKKYHNIYKLEGNLIIACDEYSNDITNVIKMEELNELLKYREHIKKEIIENVLKYI